MAFDLRRGVVVFSLLLGRMAVCVIRAAVFARVRLYEFSWPRTRPSCSYIRLRKKE